MSSIATLIPAYNAAAHIQQALDSIAAQTRLPDEIVVVDDGSTDDTAAIVTAWSSRHRQLRLQLLRQANQGASAARNAAIHAAHSDHVAFLDADDLLEPDHHARLAQALGRSDAVVCVFGQQSVFTEAGEHCANFLLGKPIEQVAYEVRDDGLRLLGEGLWAALVQGNFIPTSGSMARRQVLVAAGAFDTDLKTSEDRDLWLRVSRLGTLGYLPTRVARKREHDTNLTGNANQMLVRRHALAVIAKQLAEQHRLGLSSAEVDATRQALDAAVRTLLYAASRRGIGALRGALDEVRATAPDAAQASPRDWLRALAASASGRART